MPQQRQDDLICCRVSRHVDKFQSSQHKPPDFPLSSWNQYLAVKVNIWTSLFIYVLVFTFLSLFCPPSIIFASSRASRRTSGLELHPDQEEEPREEKEEQEKEQQEQSRAGAASEEKQEMVKQSVKHSRFFTRDEGRIVFLTDANLS